MSDKRLHQGEPANFGSQFTEILSAIEGKHGGVPVQGRLSHCVAVRKLWEVKAGVPLFGPTAMGWVPLLVPPCESIFRPGDVTFVTDQLHCSYPACRPLLDLAVQSELVSFLLFYFFTLPELAWECIGKWHPVSSSVSVVGARQDAYL